MDQLHVLLTVYFEDPFWVGVYQRREQNRLEACRVVFGPEPKDYQVYYQFLTGWNSLRFSPAVETDAPDSRRVSPKRQQRLAKSQLEDRGIGTKAQQALKMQQEQGKILRRQEKKQRSQQEKDRQFQLRQQRKKEKHRGR